MFGDSTLCLVDTYPQAVTDGFERCPEPPRVMCATSPTVESPGFQITPYPEATEDKVL